MHNVGMRMKLIVAAGVLAALLGACGGSSDSKEVAVRSSSSDRASTTTTTTSTSPTGIPHVVRTHCGVLSTTVAGVLWLADPPMGDRDHNPPPGWDENETSGTFVQLTQDNAVFKTNTGQVERFRRAPTGAKDPYEGCE